MALIVEDGSGVPNANSYTDAATVIAYAADRGVALGDDAVVEPMIIKAMDYLALFDANWSGRRTYHSQQELAFPRYGVFVDGQLLAQDQVPKNLVKAIALLCMAQHSGIELTPNDSREAFITREKVDVIETQYSEAVRLAQINAGGLLPSLPLVAALLAPLMAGGGFTLRSRRV